MNRRSFLKFTSLAAASLALPAACQPAPEIPMPMPSLAPSRTPLPTLTPISTPHATAISLPNTETWNMVSKANRQEYRILVGHRGKPTGKPLPVIYLTDGNGNFPLLYTLHQIMADDGYVPPALLVGVDYPFDNWDDYKNLRARDFTPTELSAISPFRGYFPAGTGGAPAFLEFLSTELKPLIESKYDVVADDAMLAGHSLGGLFALYTLFNQPGLFQRYLIGSPSIWYDNRVILKHLFTYESTHSDLPARVFLCVGGAEEEMVDDAQTVADRLTGKGYPSLVFSHQVFEGEKHLSMIPFFYSMGLRAIYKE